VIGAIVLLWFITAMLTLDHDAPKQ
jgi:alpha-mannosidase